MSKYEGHTPRPWKVSSYSLRGANGTHIHWDDNDTSPHPMGPEMEANAQLMEDAPMLAEQNAKMLAFIQRLHFEGDLSIAEKTYAEALIAEIEG